MRLGNTALAVERVERRLAAILAVAVDGCSHLIGTDEWGIVQAFKTARAELLELTIAEYHATRSERQVTACSAVCGCAVLHDRGAGTRGARSPLPANPIMVKACQPVTSQTCPHGSRIPTQ
jgi:hypothetical protein